MFLGEHNPEAIFSGNHIFFSTQQLLIESFFEGWQSFCLTENVNKDLLIMTPFSQCAIKDLFKKIRTKHNIVLLLCVCTNFYEQVNKSLALGELCHGSLFSSKSKTFGLGQTNWADKFWGICIQIPNIYLGFEFELGIQPSYVRSP